MLGRERGVVYTIRTSSAPPHSHGRKVKGDAAVLRTCRETNTATVRAVPGASSK